jgi:hypothetical protein
MSTIGIALCPLWSGIAALQPRAVQPPTAVDSSRLAVAARTCRPETLAAGDRLQFDASASYGQDAAVAASRYRAPDEQTYEDFQDLLKVRRQRLVRSQTR